MKMLGALVWKEWHESRSLLLIGLFVFLGLPLIGGIEQKLHGPFFELLTAPWVFFLGGVFAVFVGIATANRDLHDRLEEFWRSRPMTVAPWILIKYFIGLLIVLACGIVPLAVQRVVTPDVDMPYSAQVLLAWNPFLWAALYSIAFSIASIVRRGAHATMLALAALLLVYFLPFVLPPLQPAGILWTMQNSASPRETTSRHVLPSYHQVPWIPWPVVYEPGQLIFVGAMLLICAAALVLAIVAIRRGWRIESGRKMLYWSVGGSLLILLGSAAFQLGTNLPVLAEVSFPANEQIRWIAVEGSQGAVVTGAPTYLHAIYPLTISAAGAELGTPVRLSGFWSDRVLLSPGNSRVAYCIHWLPRQQDRQIEQLVRIRLDHPTAADDVKTVWQSTDGGPMSAFGNRLYLAGLHHLYTFDISHPLAPRLIAEEAVAREMFDSIPTDVPVFVKLLPRVPGLKPIERLQMSLRGWSWLCFDNEVAVLSAWHAGQLTTYRITELTPTFARFKHVGTYSSSLLEQLFERHDADCTGANGLVYKSDLPNRGGDSSNEPSFGGSRVTVFDVRSSARPHPVGHFAVPEGSEPLVVCPLSDGRALIGGSKLYLVGPPPRR